MGGFSCCHDAGAYNNRVRLVLKSLGFGFLGAALFFVFFSMLAVPLVGAWSRLHNANTPLQAGDVVLQPITVLRLVGLPLAAVAFVTCFAVGWRRFAHTEHS